MSIVDANHPRVVPLGGLIASALRGHVDLVFRGGIREGRFVESAVSR